MQNESPIAPPLEGATLTTIVTPSSHNQRIDTFLAREFPAFSRSFFQKLIESGHVSVHGIAVYKTSVPVTSDQVIAIRFPEQQKIIKPEHPDISSISVPIVHTHDDFLIINKPAGLIVHTPADAHKGVTLVDWLIAHYPELRNVGNEDRPGIVHRLDRDTSGLMIVPRNPSAHEEFTALFKQRKMHKTYLALVDGHPDPEGSISLPIARHPIDRLRMTHQDPQGRPALTHYSVLEYFDKHSLVAVKPVTGRTHQIRVHFAAKGHPLVGDVLYGRKSHHIDRQALHASQLAFAWQDQCYQFTQALPEDFVQAVAALSGKTPGSHK